MDNTLLTTKQTHGDAIDLVIVIGDTHTNSTRGPKPPRFYDKSKKQWVYAARAVVLHLWEPWLQMWRKVAAEKARLEALGYTVRVIVVFNGDGPDRNRHDREGYEIVTPERNAITDLCERTLAPALVSGLVDVWVFNRGTEAHEGGSGELMEMLAERVSRRANVWRDGPDYSHYWPRFLIQGVDVMFGHHPASGSRLYHTRRQAAARTATHYWNGFNVPVITRNSISYDREKPPDVMFFGHLHYDADSGVDASNPIRVYYVASWQLPYSYIHRIGRGAIPNAVGCRWLWCQDGEYTCKPWLHRPAAGKAIRL